MPFMANQIDSSALCRIFLRIGPQLSQLVTDSNQSTNNFIYWKDLDKLRVAADENPNQLP